MKVVHLFMEHIFHNWRHFKFEVEMVQKSGQSSETPLDRAEKKCHFGKNFSVKPRFKSHVGLWQSCRGMYELQLCYLPICSLSSKILSNF
jgi:hypothetical protein